LPDVIYQTAYISHCYSMTLNCTASDHENTITALGILARLLGNMMKQ